MVGQGKYTKPGSAEIEAKPEGPAFAVRELSCSLFSIQVAERFRIGRCTGGRGTRAPFFALRYPSATVGVGCERRASDVLCHACSEAAFLCRGAPPAPGAGFPSPFRGVCG